MVVGSFSTHSLSSRSCARQALQVHWVSPRAACGNNAVVAHGSYDCLGETLEFQSEETVSFTLQVFADINQPGRHWKSFVGNHLAAKLK